MKVLLLGEIVGRCGTGVIKHALRKFRKQNDIDFVIAGGECVTGGYGLGFSNAQLLLGMGIDVLTMGEKSFYKDDMVQNIGRKDRILRPANFPENAPGRGVKYYNVGEKKICVINSLGMLGFQNPHLANPFLKAEALVASAREITPFVFYVFHAQATAEKKAMGYLLDGKASAVCGLHTKVQTSDATVLAGKTAYITDLGRCGSLMSVGGFKPENEIKKFRTGVVFRSMESFESPVMQGLLVTLDDTGFALFCEAVSLSVDVPLPKDFSGQEAVTGE